jgi:hypothetical protein
MGSEGFTWESVEFAMFIDAGWSRRNAVWFFQALLLIA